MIIQRNILFSIVMVVSEPLQGLPTNAIMRQLVKLNIVVNSIEGLGEVQ